MSRPADEARSTAERIAGECVAFVERKFGFALPYTPGSLIVADAIVDKIRETGATDRQAARLLVGLGCYAGEVLTRHARGSWRTRAEMGLRGAATFPLVVAFPGAVCCDVVEHVFRRFRDPEDASLAALYEGRQATVSGPAIDAASAPRSDPQSRSR